MPAVDRRVLSSVVALLLGGALASACHRGGGKSRVAVADDVDAIARALADNERRLADAGVAVAYRAPAPAVSGAAGGDAAGDGAGAGTAPVDLDDEEKADAALQDAPEVTATAPVEMETRESTHDAPLSREHRRAKRASTRDEDDRCDRLCGLAETTCELRDRVCELSERHQGDTRYSDSCARAEDQCDAATVHCESCER
ncbi:MAG: hypothetical protein K1X88_00695 [Nannocystaceae bacterium]|nr:hypothetical protein [Nannocystaceae bacterium]